ncbi:DUF72 domain-containing protein [Haloferula sargassicola]|uniref:DUF72 domain-containing protein n=1 Tax=Haloferula sargassicola TaxID=490096 RepID=A0ABP9USG9_9BACT
MNRVARRCRIGISGWTYPPWRGGFYPEDLRHKDELHFASRQVNTIEINGTFYSLQRPESFRKWREETPDDFVFSIKGGRFITHIKRLKDVATPLANFFASGVLALGTKLGPFLWQLPPSFRYDRGVLDEFLGQLPRDTGEASRLARRHDDKLTGRSVLTPAADMPLRHALEIRHESFENEEFIELLRFHEVALVIADTAGKWPFLEDITAPFLYLRLHGDEELYASGYTSEALEGWEAKIRSWTRGSTPRGSKCVAPRLPPRKSGRDVYVYFDNDIKVHAPFDAMSLASRLGLRAPEVSPDDLPGV